ncbi:MAG: hypothetical protein V4501_00180 [Pseudomonadota bacterium]
MPILSHEYLELDKKLLDIEFDLASEWPIIPRENLNAGKIFLIRVLTLSSEKPNLTVNECVLLAAEEFDISTHPVGLAKVTTMQPNYPILNWGVFKYFISCNTPLGDYIEQTRTQFLEKNAAKMAELNRPANDDLLPLLADFDDNKRYGSCR